MQNHLKCFWSFGHGLIENHVNAKPGRGNHLRSALVACNMCKIPALNSHVEHYLEFLLFAALLLARYNKCQVLLEKINIRKD